MSESMASGAVNSHCLEHIMALAEQQDIVAAEDIVDDRGIKLWAKGQKVSRSLQEKLLRHRLARPLETALTVDGGIVAEQVVTECLRLAESNELMRRICGGAAARSLLSGFRNTPLPGPFKLLLTSARETGLATYQHSLHCVGICAGIAARLNLSDHDAQQLLLSALLHDIGELYIDPGYIRSTSRLAPSEWRQVAVHPRIGQMLIEELTSLPAAIGTTVAEHHERLDGSGYPAQHVSDGISRHGRVMAVADTAAAIVANSRSDSADRLAVAMRIVPEEFDHTVVRALIERIDTTPTTGPGDDALIHIHRVVDRLKASTFAAQSLAEQSGSAVAADTCGYVLAALHLLDKALCATGAADAEQLGDIATDQTVLAEIWLVAREVEWRLRNLARRIYLRVHINHDGADLALVLPLIETLDSPLSPAA
jgi:HD-GYP domain-containing protein (c-di-GMP phosphodiesterase class II)